jgi:hypothetical protein
VTEERHCHTVCMSENVQGRVHTERRLHRWRTTTETMSLALKTKKRIKPIIMDVWPLDPLLCLKIKTFNHLLIQFWLKIKPILFEFVQPLVELFKSELKY